MEFVKRFESKDRVDVSGEFYTMLEVVVNYYTQYNDLKADVAIYDLDINERIEFENLSNEDRFSVNKILEEFHYEFKRSLC